MSLLHKLMFAAAFAAAAALSAAEVPNPDAEAKKQIEEAGKLFRKNFPGSGIVYDLRYVEQALTAFRQIQKTPGLSPAVQSQLARRIAGCLLELDRGDEAFAELKNALNIKGLTPVQIQDLDIYLADRYLELNRYGEAEKIYRKYNRNDQVFLCMLKAGKRQEAVDFIRKAGADGAKISQLRQRMMVQGPMAVELDQLALNELLADLNAADGKDGKTAWNILVPAVRLQLKFDREKALTLARKYADAVQEPAYYEKLFLNDEAYKVFSTDLKFTGKIFDLAMKRNPGAVKANLPKYVDFLFASGDMAKLKEIFARMDPKAKTQKYQLMEAALFGTMNAAQIADLAKDRKPDQKLAFLVEAAETASFCRNEKLTRELWAVREKMLAKQEKPALNCPFLTNCPSDIAGFLAMKADPKNVGTLNRKFGNNLQLLLDTDASTTTRKISADKQLAGYTTFTAACDAQGINFFFIMPCTKAKSAGIRLGTQSMGGFELYLAPGFDKPYHTFLIDCPPNVSLMDTFMTEYSNPDFLRAMRRNKNVDLSFRVDDDKVMMLLHLDWTVCIDRVPQDGDVWEFEPIHWEQGGLSWGGSESVHNRSKFGKIVFTGMTKAHRAAIMRRLLFKVKNSFWRQWSAWQRGFAERYADPELGDPEFYAQVLLPLRAKYDACAKRITPEMTDDEAIAVYNEAFCPMFNIKAMVEKLRHEYLLKKMTQAE